MTCKCKVCSDIKRWEAVLVKDEESRKAFEEIMLELEAASTDKNVYEAIFEGTWPSAKEQLQSALNRISAEPESSK